MNEQEKQALIDHAKENVKALKMASRQSAFKEWKGSIETDLKLAEIALAALTTPPAVNLADLVPEEMSEDQAAYQDCKGGLSTAFMEGANYMRAEILRRIEETGGAA